MEGAVYNLMFMEEYGSLEKNFDADAKLQAVTEKLPCNILHCCSSQQRSQTLLTQWGVARWKIVEKTQDRNIPYTLILCELTGEKNSGHQQCLSNCDKWHIMKREGSFIMNVVITAPREQ